MLADLTAEKVEQGLSSTRIRKINGLLKVDYYDTKTTNREGLNDDNDENRSEGYGSVRRRLVKKAETVDSFDVEAMAIVGSHGSLRVCISEPFASGVTSLRSGRMQIETTQSLVGSENSGGELNSGISQEMLKGETEADDGSGNKVMVVIDSNMESKGALHWALDDTVQNQDTMILLHIATGSKLGSELLDCIITKDASTCDEAASPPSAEWLKLLSITQATESYYPEPSCTVTTPIGTINNKPKSSGMALIEWKYDQGML
ncbi:Rossmann-like alpha/beta/alpha sandwich fold protein [Tanacetum coccineum]